MIVATALAGLALLAGQSSGGTQGIKLGDVLGADKIQGWIQEERIIHGTALAGATNKLARQSGSLSFLETWFSANEALSPARLGFFLPNSRLAARKFDELIPSETLLFFQPPCGADGIMLVVMLDGRVREIRKPEWDSLAARSNLDATDIGGLAAEAKQGSPDLLSLMREVDMKTGGAGPPDDELRRRRLPIFVPEAANQSNLHQLGLATMMYMGDYDDRLPSGKSFSAVKPQISPYVKNDSLFLSALTGLPYGFNRAVSGKDTLGLDSPSRTILFYEHVSFSGRRAVAFADGTARNVDDAEFDALTKRGFMADAVPSALRDPDHLAKLKRITSEMARVAELYERGAEDEALAAAKALREESDQALGKSHALAKAVQAAFHALSFRKSPTTNPDTGEELPRDMLPVVYYRARSAARGMLALSYGKQLALGAMMYQSDNDDCFPVGTSMASVYKKALDPYVKNPALVQDPATGLSFRFNRWLSGRPAASLDNPSEVILFHSALPDVTGRITVAFADGHAKRLTVKEFDTARKRNYREDTFKVDPKSHSSVLAVAKAVELLLAGKFKEASAKALEALAKLPTDAASAPVREWAATESADILGLTKNRRAVLAARNIALDAARRRRASADDIARRTEAAANAALDTGDLEQAVRQFEFVLKHRLSVAKKDIDRIVSGQAETLGIGVDFSAMNLERSISELMASFDHLIRLYGLLGRAELVTARFGEVMPVVLGMMKWSTDLLGQVAVLADPRQDPETMPLLATQVQLYMSLKLMSANPNDTAAAIDLARLTMRGGNRESLDFVQTVPVLIGLYLREGRIDEAAASFEDLRTSLRRFGLDRMPGGTEGLAALEGLILSARGKDEAAKPLLESVAASVSKDGDQGMTPHLLNQVYSELARIALRGGETGEAMRLALARFEVHAPIAQSWFAFASEAAMSDYMTSMQPALDMLLSVPAGGRGDERVYSVVANQKGNVVDTTARYRRGRSLLESDPKVAKVFARLQVAKQELANLASNPESADRTKTIQTRIDDLAGQVASYLSKKGVRGLTEVNSESIRKRIRDGEVLVDIVRYTPLDPRATGFPIPALPPRYAAFVVTPKSVQRVDLGGAGEWDAKILEFRSFMVGSARSRNIVPKKRGKEDPARMETLAKDLFQALFPRIVPLLDGAKTILLAPDGEFFNLPVDALMTAEGKYLVEEFNVVTVDSARDLVREESAIGQGAYVFADPDYDLAPSIQLGSTLGSAWAPLAGAKQEGLEVASLLQEAGEKQVRHLTGTKATEGAFKAIHSPRIVHFATHGFFLPDLKATAVQPALGGEISDMLQRAASPSLRSGLVLAGANWSARSTPGASDDGWLTAEEIGLADLQGLDLVVLSACETGLGDYRTGSGVFGLRRAFLEAGAKSVVMSLFQVPDEPTRKLMRAFYKGLASGRSKMDSLRQAKLELLRSPETAKPIHWASFVLIGRG